MITRWAAAATLGRSGARAGRLDCTAARRAAAAVPLHACGTWHIACSQLTPAAAAATLPIRPQLGIHLADDPVLCAWRGAALLAASPSHPRLAVTQKEWRSRGTAALAKWEQ